MEYPVQFLRKFCRSPPRAMFPAARSTAERKPCFSVEKQGLPVQKQSFRALIPGLAAADPAVFDGSGRAAADTGHAVGAAVPQTGRPSWMRMFPSGQSRWHFPQDTQASETVKGPVRT